MLKTFWLLHIIILCFFGLAYSGQETIQVFNLHDTSPEILNSLAHIGQSVAVSLHDRHLYEISSSILVAESWLTANVLPHYPATQITTILIGFLDLNKINLIKEAKPTSRKLSFVEPYPARPSPLQEIPPSKFHSSVGCSVPANLAKSPHIAPTQHAPPPTLSFPTTPELSLTLPPCSSSSRYDAEAPAPVSQMVEKLWCVAKPNVPEETLQEELEYACGEGGADCEEIIKPYGNCYYPDTVVAHASYAFNSYWQKNKRHGGTCNFGGTAMIINSDPFKRRWRPSNSLSVP